MSLLTIQKKIDLLTVMVENMTVKAVLIEVARIEKKDGVVKKLLSTILVDAEKNQKIADKDYNQTRVPLWKLSKEMKGKLDSLEAITKQKDMMVHKMTSELRELQIANENPYRAARFSPIYPSRACGCHEEKSLASKRHSKEDLRATQQDKRPRPSFFPLDSLATKHVQQSGYVADAIIEEQKFSLI